jgi:hypothetical protein
LADGYTSIHNSDLEISTEKKLVVIRGIDGNLKGYTSIHNSDLEISTEKKTSSYSWHRWKSESHRAN